MKTASLLASIAFVSLLSGCGGTSYSSIRHDLTPELQGTSERWVDRDRSRHIAYNANHRMFHDDMGRVFLYDSPSRLSPYPILYTSTGPR